MFADLLSNSSKPRAYRRGLAGPRKADGTPAGDAPLVEMPSATDLMLLTFEDLRRNRPTLTKHGLPGSPMQRDVGYYSMPKLVVLETGSEESSVSANHALSSDTTNPAVEPLADRTPIELASHTSPTSGYYVGVMAPAALEKGPASSASPEVRPAPEPRDVAYTRPRRRAISMPNMAVLQFGTVESHKRIDECGRVHRWLTEIGCRRDDKFQGSGNRRRLTAMVQQMIRR